MKNTIFSILAYFLLHCSATAIQTSGQSNWCWAACIQDVCAQAGKYYTQPQIVGTLYGPTLPNNPAPIAQVVNLLHIANLTAWPVPVPATPDALYSTLISGWKIIAFVNPMGGAVGHFIVLQGIHPMNGGIIVSDPANGMTYVSPVSTLYNAWQWQASIVIGKPF